MEKVYLFVCENMKEIPPEDYLILLVYMYNKYIYGVRDVQNEKEILDFIKQKEDAVGLLDVYNYHSKVVLPISFYINDIIYYKQTPTSERKEYSSCWACKGYIDCLPNDFSSPCKGMKLRTIRNA